MRQDTEKPEKQQTYLGKEGLQVVSDSQKPGEVQVAGTAHIEMGLKSMPCSGASREGEIPCLCRTGLPGKMSG